MSREPGSVKKPLRIVLDSNALFVPLKFKIDIFEELRAVAKTNYEPVLLSPVLHELEQLARAGKAKVKKNASYALELAKRCKVINVDQPDRSTVDDIIMNMAAEWRTPVFTNDRQLRKRLRNINVPVIYVRQKSKLEIEGRL
jgi:rRNA-processing protein FCF1